LLMQMSPGDSHGEGGAAGGSGSVISHDTPTSSGGLWPGQRLRAPLGVPEFTACVLSHRDHNPTILPQLLHPPAACMQTFLPDVPPHDCLQATVPWQPHRCWTCR
jgi:hypothetical protein